MRSYGRMGLSTRPLTIYTAGGAEKDPEQPKTSGVGVSTIKPRWSEGVIKRKEDGTIEVVYPDSDDEEQVEAITSAQDETPVVKGSLRLGLS
jgi:hypothetical protein